MQENKILKIFVCETFEVEQKEKRKFEVPTKSPYMEREEIFSNVLESLFADVNCYAMPPTFINKFNQTENQYVI